MVTILLGQAVSSHIANTLIPPIPLPLQTPPPLPLHYLSNLASSPLPSPSLHPSPTHQTTRSHKAGDTINLPPPSSAERSQNSKPARSVRLDVASPFRAHPRSGSPMPFRGVRARDVSERVPLLDMASAVEGWPVNGHAEMG